MKNLLIASVALCGFVGAAAAAPQVTGEAAPIRCDSKQHVTGSGNTYREALDDAHARLPSGAQEEYVRSRQENGMWYVDIYYH